MIIIVSANCRASLEAVEKENFKQYFDNRIAEINNTLLIQKTNDKGHVKQTLSELSNELETVARQILITF